MFFIFLAELIALVFCFQEWGFIDTLGIYLMPSFLGIIVLSMSGVGSLMSLQASMSAGGSPEKKILHRVAIFIGGVFLIIPMWTTRLIAVILLLPGLRHLALGRMQKVLSQKMAAGGQGFQSGPFGFKYYNFTNMSQNPFDPNRQAERDVTHSQDILDVTPIKVSHEAKKEDQ